MKKYGYKSFLTILSKNYIKKNETVSNFYGCLGMRFLADSKAKLAISGKVAPKFKFIRL